MAKGLSEETIVVTLRCTRCGHEARTNMILRYVDGKRRGTIIEPRPDWYEIGGQRLCRACYDASAKMGGSSNG